MAGTLLALAAYGAEQAHGIGDNAVVIVTEAIHCALKNVSEVVRRRGRFSSVGVFDLNVFRWTELSDRAPHPQITR